MHPDDIQALLAEVSRFCQRVAPLAERPELAPTPAGLERLARAAGDAGLLDDEDDAGAGLWSELARRDAPRVTVGALERLARVSTAAAWHLHSTAFSAWLARRLGWSELAADGPVVASVQGSYGLARYALARWLRGAELGTEARALLVDYFQPAGDGLCPIAHAARGFRWLVCPAVVGETVQWHAYPSDALAIDARDDGHGLDGISALSWAPRRAPTHATELAPREARTVYAEALEATWLALVACALGAAARGAALARDYASARVQGGAAIEQHPAVQLMLAEIRASLDAVTASLERAADRPLGLDRVGELAVGRIAAHPALSRAANHALQVFGGLGYMRDTGVESVVRDCMQLRLMNGTPTELALFVAAWEGAS
jgi:alkylation response protein AidB-like acyl-CoA dehydrogenase